MMMLPRLTYSDRDQTARLNQASLDRPSVGPSVRPSHHPPSLAIIAVLGFPGGTIIDNRLSLASRSRAIVARIRGWYWANRAGGNGNAGTRYS